MSTLTHGLSDGLTESVNTKLRLITRRPYGFRSTDNLIALCLLDEAATDHRSLAGQPPHDPRKRTESQNACEWAPFLREH